MPAIIIYYRKKKKRRCFEFWNVPRVKIEVRRRKRKYHPLTPPAASLSVAVSKNYSEIAYRKFEKRSSDDGVASSLESLIVFN